MVIRLTILFLLVFSCSNSLIQEEPASIKFDNAIKYSDDGDVCLYIEKNDEVKFHVKDSGIGISEEHIEQITRQFYTT